MDLLTKSFLTSSNTSLLLQVSLCVVHLAGKRNKIWCIVHRCICGSYPANRCIQVIKTFFLNAVSDLRRNGSKGPLFFHNYQAVCFLTLSRMVNQSSGRMVAKSITSAYIFFASSSAAPRATFIILLKETMVTSLPCLLTKALPMGKRYSSSGTSPFSPYITSLSIKITGSSSRMALLITLLHHKDY